MAEMTETLLLDSDEPVLAKGSVCHTNGAKAYRSLASPLNNGTLSNFPHLCQAQATPPGIHQKIPG